MEKVVKKICLDSDFIINLLNGDENTKKLLESLDAIFYTTVISVFEIWYGRKKNENILELLQSFNILEMDNESALISADILRQLKNKGNIIDLRDSFIAGICIKNEMELLTYNKKHFERVKVYGLKLTI